MPAYPQGRRYKGLCQLYAPGPVFAFSVTPRGFSCVVKNYTCRHSMYFFSRGSARPNLRDSAPRGASTGVRRVPKVGQIFGVRRFAAPSATQNKFIAGRARSVPLSTSCLILVCARTPTSRFRHGVKRTPTPRELGELANPVARSPTWPMCRYSPCVCQPSDVSYAGTCNKGFKRLGRKVEAFFISGRSSNSSLGHRKDSANWPRPPLRLMCLQPLRIAPFQA